MQHSSYPATSLFGRLQFHPLLGLMAGLTLIMATLLLAQLAATALVHLALGVDMARMMELTHTTTEATTAELTALKILLGFSQLIGFGLAAYTLAVWSGPPQHELAWRPTPWHHWALAALWMLATMPVLQALILSPERFALPDGLQAVEQWIETSEKDIETTLRPMLSAQLWLNLIVVALCPALAEEFLFRGFFQSTLQRMMRPAAAIWVQAVLFSAFHMQFLGFIPRLLMGAGFGYLRLWSGSIWPAVVAHFVNNALGVVVAYYAFNGVVDEKLAASDYSAPWGMVIGGAFVSAAVLYRFYQTRITTAHDH